MYRLAAAILMTAALATSAVAEETKPSYFSGSDYLALPAEARSFYVAGLMDMVNFLDFVMTEQARKALVEQARRCVGNLSADELRNMVDAYVRSEPANLRYSMASNFTAAIVTRCPA